MGKILRRKLEANAPRILRGRLQKRPQKNGIRRQFHRRSPAALQRFASEQQRNLRLRPNRTRKRRPRADGVRAASRCPTQEQPAAEHRLLQAADVLQVAADGDHHEILRVHVLHVVSELFVRARRQFEGAPRHLLGRVFGDCGTLFYCGFRLDKRALEEEADYFVVFLLVGNVRIFL